MSKNLSKPANPGRKDARTNISAKPGTGDWLEASGLGPWAGRLGVSAPAALAATASILTGAAAGGWYACSWGRQPLPKLDLIVPEPLGRTARCVAALGAPAAILNQRLTERAAGFSPMVFDHLAFGSFADNQQSRPGAATATSAAVARHRQALDLEDDQPFLAADLEHDGQQCRREAIVHPAFLLAGPRASDLSKLAEECHKRTGLVLQLRFPTKRRDHQARRDAIDLAELLDGRLQRPRPTRLAARVEPPCVTLVHAILHPERQDYEALAEVAPELLDRCLLVDETSDNRQGSDLADGNAFFHSYQQALFQILELRREGRMPLFEFENKESANVFEGALRRFENECDNLPAEPGVSARGLPLCLMWAMGFLRQHLPQAPGLADGAMIRAAFEASRHLLAGHVRACRKLRTAGMVAERLKFAGKIAREVKERAPLKPRDLMRLFFNQRKERFEPVIEALIGLRVLGRDPNGMFVPGTVEFAKARRELELLFIEALCDGQEEKKTSQAEEKKTTGGKPRADGDVGKDAGKLVVRKAPNKKPQRRDPTPATGTHIDSIDRDQTGNPATDAGPPAMAASQLDEGQA
jgi:hypothetical protein